MSIAVLTVINQELESIGINYEFGQWSSDITYPYFVGEYQEVPSVNEDGMQETAFLLTGFSRGSWLALEQAKEKIVSHFKSGNVVIVDNSTVAIFYENSLVIPTGDAELKKIQINLKIKEWSVN